MISGFFPVLIVAVMFGIGLMALEAMLNRERIRLAILWMVWSLCLVIILVSVLVYDLPPHADPMAVDTALGLLP